MMQKIIQVGNSLAITIPKSLVREAQIKAGQMIRVDLDNSTQSLTVQPVEKTTSQQDAPTPEFLSWLKKFNSRYKIALTELAKK